MDIDKKAILDAWARIRKIDQTIPDEVLDFMKDSALQRIVEPGIWEKRVFLREDGIYEWDQGLFEYRKLNYALAEDEMKAVEKLRAEKAQRLGIKTPSLVRDALELIKEKGLI